VCTVSYIKINNGFILTSNRDELVSRPALPPAFYNENGKTLLFPKDELGHGSWIASDKGGHVSCLLNGAFEKHKRQLPYSKSRGVVLLESFAHDNVSTFLQKVNLYRVEPFTLVMASKDAVTELKWDGTKKHIKVHNPEDNHIWSSPTLYPLEVSVKKERWFKEWMTKYALEKERNIYNFHNTRHGTNPSEDVLSKFSEELKTVSITEVEVSQDKVKMTYHDLIREKTDSRNFKELTGHV